MLINLSNHPSTLWSEEQKEAALLFGKIIDLPFPVVDPAGKEEYIKGLANDYFEKIKNFSQHKKLTDITVHLMGEMTFVYALLQNLKEVGIRAIASTTQRQTKDLGNGQKESLFKFVQFRSYY